jgi:hypothetical protein
LSYLPLTWFSGQWHPLQANISILPQQGARE